MSSERELTENMKDELKRHGIVATYNDYQARTAHLIDLNDGFHQVIDYIPDFIMIDLLKEYELAFSPYSNISEFVEGVLGYKRGIVQQMRRIAKHFFVFNPDIKEFELDKDFLGFTSTQLEKMSQWSKQELLDAGITPAMKVYEIDAKVRENGKKKSVRVTDEEYRIITAYDDADDEMKKQVKALLKLN